MSSKMVYFFGSGKAEGQAKMKETLGGKGARKCLTPAPSSIRCLRSGQATF